MQFDKYVFSRGVCKTGQDTMYQSGDDGTYEKGWWLGRTVANNRVRLVPATIAGDLIVLDRATSLIWAGDGNEAGCNNGVAITWANAITYANALSFAGFSDWCVPNVKQVMSLLDYGRFDPLGIAEPPFINTTGSYWTSTTYLNETDTAYRIVLSSGTLFNVAKTTELHIRCVRLGL